MSLYDRLKSFSTKLLRQPQTDQAELIGLKNYYAEHPTNGMTPQSLAMLLQDAEQGNIMAQCELAEDMEEKDAHLFSELQKRKRAFLGVDRRLEPPRNASKQEEQDTALLNEWLEDAPWMDDLILNMADAILKGFSNSEIIWRKEGSFWTIDDVPFRDPSWFQVNPESRNQITLRDSSYTGAALQPLGWVSHTHLAKSGYIARGGLVRVLAWPFLFRALSTRDFAEMLEIYGLPIRLGKYPTGASDDEKRTLRAAIAAIGHNAGGIMPKGMDLEVIEAAKGVGDPFSNMISWAEKSMSKAILGGTLTSQADGKTSTNALGNVHNEVRIELRDSDLAQLGQTLTRDIVIPLYALNGKSYNNPRRHPRFIFDTSEPEDMKLFANSLPALSQVMRIPAQWAHDKLQIPQAEEGEELLQPVSKEPEQPESPKPEAAATAALKAEDDVHGSTNVAGARDGGSDPELQLLDALNAIDSGELQQQMEQLLQPIIELVDQQGPEVALGQLAEKYPEMDESQLQEQLARVMFVADTWSRLNMESEHG